MANIKRFGAVAVVPRPVAHGISCSNRSSCVAGAGQPGLRSKSEPFFSKNGLSNSPSSPLFRRHQECWESLSHVVVQDGVFDLPNGLISLSASENHSKLGDGTDRADRDECEDRSEDRSLSPATFAQFDFSRQEFLVIRRSSSVIAPRTLCFPGGGIEPGERPEEAACREFFEEIGLVICVRQKIWENVTPWQVHLDWFWADLTANASDPSVPMHGFNKADSLSEAFLWNPNSEVEEIFWMSFPQLLEHPDLLQSNVPFLQGALNGTIVF